MLVHPAWHTIFRKKRPEVQFLDLRSDDTNTNIYTFTACYLGELGSTYSSGGNDFYGTNPILRSTGRKQVVVCVHGEDAAVTFGISSVTIGGIAGTERSDRGGATNAINTGVYVWNTSSLQDIANTDIVVTWTEAITSCAIGLLMVENVGIAAEVASSDTTGTGVITTSPNFAAGSGDLYPVIILASTCATGGGTETFDPNVTGTTKLSSAMPYTMLYEGNTAEMDFAAAWSYSPQYNDGNTTGAVANTSQWTGTGAGDATEVVLY